MNTNISNNSQENIYSQTQTQPQTQTNITGKPWQSPHANSTLNAAPSGSNTVTTHIGVPLLPPPGSPAATPASRIAGANGITLGAGTHIFNIQSLNYTRSGMIRYLEEVVAKEPHAIIAGTTPSVFVKDLLKKGTAAHDILHYLNATAELSSGITVPVRRLNPFIPPIDTGSLSPDYTISPQYNIKVQDLHTVGSLANTIYTYLNNVSQLIANAPTSTKNLTPLPSLEDTGATAPQISAAISNTINNLPSGDTKTIFQFLNDHGGEEGLANLPPDTVVIHAEGSRRAVKVADLRKTGSPAHAVVLESNSMRLILGILIQLKNMLSRMQEWAVGNLKQLQEQRDAQVEQQQAATNKQIADNNKNIQQIQAAAAAAAQSAKWGLWGNIIGIVVSVVAMAVTIALTPFTGGASDAALPAEAAGLSTFIAGASIATSVTMAGISVAQLASGNQFLSDAMSKLGSDMMSALGPIGGPIVAALIVALTIALTKGAGARLAAAGVSQGAITVATMASVTLASTLLGSSNIIALGVADLFHDPNSEVAQIVSSIVQTIILLAVAIASGKMMMSGGRLFGEAEGAASSTAKVAEDVVENAAAVTNSPTASAAATAAAGGEGGAVQRAGDASISLAEASAKEGTKVNKSVETLSEFLTKLKEDESYARQLAIKANQLNTAAGAASGATTGIAKGILAVKQVHILNTQADIQKELAIVEALITMIKHAIKLLDDNFTQFQTMLNQIADENGHVMDASKKMMAAQSSLLQKIESA